MRLNGKKTFTEKQMCHPLNATAVTRVLNLKMAVLRHLSFSEEIVLAKFF